MNLPTDVTRALGIELPVVLAPMGGGPGTPALAAAVSGGGGLGSLAAGYEGPPSIRDQIAALRRATDRPFAVNLFTPGDVTAAEEEVEAVLAVLGPLREELGLPRRPDPVVAVPYAPDFGSQIETVLAERPPVVSFTFGIPPPGIIDELHRAAILVIGTATSVSEAAAFEAAGADLVVTQSAEAGAHSGSFEPDPALDPVGALALVPQVCDRVAVPVIAAGGVMDGRGAAAAFALGAGAVQMGTAFLRCPEAGTTGAHRQALAGAGDTSTTLTASITGRRARGITNRLMTALGGRPVPPYPVMNSLTSELRRTAGSRDDPELMSLWAGQGVALGTDRPAAEVLRGVVEGADAVLTRLAGAS